MASEARCPGNPKPKRPRRHPRQRMAGRTPRASEGSARGIIERPRMVRRERRSDADSCRGSTSHAGHPRWGADATPRVRPPHPRRPRGRRHRQPVVRRRRRHPRQGRIAAMGRAARQDGRAHDRRDAAWSSRPDSSTSTTTPTTRVLDDGDAREHGPPGRHVDDLRRGRLGGAVRRACRDFAAYFAALTPSGDRHQRRLVRRLEPGLDRGPRRAGRAAHGGRARRDARARARRRCSEGALGVASSLSGPPGAWIDTDTLVAMCEVAAEYGGIYSTHMRNEGRRLRRRRGGDRDRPARAACRWTSSTSRSPSTRCGARCPS